MASIMLDFGWNLLPVIPLPFVSWISQAHEEHWQKGWRAHPAQFGSFA
jgi:hypothetical protein